MISWENIARLYTLGLSTCFVVIEKILLGVIGRKAFLVIILKEKLTIPHPGNWKCMTNEKKKSTSKHPYCKTI